MNVDTPHPGSSGVGLVWHWRTTEHGSGIRVMSIDACALLKSGALAPRNGGFTRSMVFLWR